MNLAVEKNKTYRFKSTVAFLFLLLTCWSCFCFSQKEQIGQPVRIFGSSTVFPFMALLTERLYHDINFAPAIVESTGTGAGLKMLCTSSKKKVASIATASRRITSAEKKRCEKDLNQKVSEYILGLDGLVLVVPKTSPSFSLTTRELRLALSAYIQKNTTDKAVTLVRNPYKLWSDINPQLPKISIKIYGPPRNSGLYEALSHLLFKSACKDLNNKEKSLCQKVRSDGFYVEMPENSMLMIKKLEQDFGAIGIVSFRLFDQNRSTFKALSIENFFPCAKNIRSKSYPLVRNLYIYIKEEDKNNPYIRTFLNYLKQEEVIGPNGDFERLGLVTQL